MNALFRTDDFDDVYAFDRDIARPTARNFVRLTGDTDSFNIIRERLIQEFSQKGFGKRPSRWNRLVFGEHRFMRVDVDEKTKDVLITNGIVTGSVFMPYPISKENG